MLSIVVEKRKDFNFLIYLTLFFSVLCSSVQPLFAACSNPAWIITTAYALNDIVSGYDGKDYKCTNAVWDHLNPPDDAGNLGWTLENDPCVSGTPPQPWRPQRCRRLSLLLPLAVEVILQI